MQAVRVDERRLAAEYLHPVPTELVGDHRGLTLHDVRDSRHQLTDLRPGLGPERRAACRPHGPQHRLSECLARDGAGVETHAAECALALHHGHPPSHLGRLHRAALSGGTAPDTHQVEVVDVCHVIDVCGMRARGNSGCVTNRYEGAAAMWLAIPSWRTVAATVPGAGSPFVVTRRYGAGAKSKRLRRLTVTLGAHCMVHA